MARGYINLHMPPEERAKMLCKVTLNRIVQRDETYPLGWLLAVYERAAEAQQIAQKRGN